MYTVHQSGELSAIQLMHEWYESTAWCTRLKLATLENWMLNIIKTDNFPAISWTLVRCERLWGKYLIGRAIERDLPAARSWAWTFCNASTLTIYYGLANLLSSDAFVLTPGIIDNRVQVLGEIAHTALDIAQHLQTINREKIRAFIVTFCRVCCSNADWSRAFAEQRQRLIEHAARIDDLDLVRWLHEQHGCKLTSTVFHEACLSARTTELVRWLIDHGCTTKDLERNECLYRYLFAEMQLFLKENKLLATTVWVERDRNSLL
jgi:hypothetical protein